ncbi:hypothetical protein [Nocardioides limicola]|uniref:hypothetical protein n=1 Tax=Nocardioides limicola TaxID=2803368 RepID=UPI00193B9659|nr:hypothetical protein [Nocardioides sp. DJM-14]
MEVLWWLAPSAAVALGAMAWVTWVGRDAHDEVDREQQVAKLGRALAKPHPAARRTPTPRRPAERSTGVAVRQPRDDTRRSA